MRPPERIDEMMQLLTSYWKKVPDMRFMQLIYCLQHDFSEHHQGRGRIEAPEKDTGFKRVGFDLFHLEDSEFREFLEGSVKRSEEDQK